MKNDLNALRIAIIDDDPVFSEKAGRLARACLKEMNQEPVVCFYNDSGPFWEDFQRGPHDVVLIDIMLPGENGIALARKVYERSRAAAIVFITSSPDYALHGYGVDAVGYMLKPLCAASMGKILAQCVARLRARDRYAFIKSGAAIVRLRIPSILYLESNNKRVLVHCDEGAVDCHGKLEDMLRLLPVAWLRVHKSYAANIERVVGMKKDVVRLDVGRELPVSRRFRASAEQRFISHVATEARL